MSACDAVAGPEDLKVFSLLLEFNAQERIDLYELLQPLRLEAGQSLFDEADEADTLYLLAAGSLRIKSAACGDLGLLGCGSSLGAVSLMTLGTREASAIAESECQLLGFDRAGFLHLAEDAPRTACRLAEAVVSRLAAALRPKLTRIKHAFASDEIAPSG